MADERIDIQFGAQLQGLLGGLTQATSAVAGATTAMKGSLEGLGAAAKSAMAPLLAFTALLEGGEFFKGAVAATTSWTYSNVLLSRQLGITTQDASVLSVALGDIFVSSETFTHAAMMMTRQLNTGGKGFQTLGIEVRDANGNLKPTTALMVEVLEKLNGLKAGTDRNAAGLQIFSRAWADAQKLLKLTPAIMEEAAQKAERLNLLVGGDAVTATMHYKSAMHEVEEALTAVKIVIGKQLLPVLTQLATWFSDKGPAAIRATITAFREFQVLLEFFRGGHEAAFTLDLEKMIEVSTRSQTSFALSRHEFELMTANMMAMTEMGGNLDARLSHLSNETLAQLATATARVKMSELASPEQVARAKQLLDLVVREETLRGALVKPAAPAGPEGGTLPAPDTSAQLSALQVLQDKWLDTKEKLGAFRSDQLQAELDFWTANINTANLKASEKLSVHRRIVELSQQITRDEYTAEQALAKASLADAGNDARLKLAILDQEGEEIAASLGVRSKQYLDYLTRRATAEKEAEKQTEAIALRAEKAEQDHELALVALERQSLDLRVQLGSVAADQRLAIEQQLLEREYSIKRAALERERALAGAANDPAKVAEINAQLLALADQLGLSLAQTSATHTLAIRDQWLSVFSTITDAVRTSFNGIIQGTQTVAQAFANLGRNIVLSMASAALDTVKSHAAAELAKRGITAASVGERVALETWAAIQTVAVNSWAALVSIANYAATGIAAAWAAISAIPIIGPILAPGVALATGAAILALAGNVKSARGGYDVPAGLEPITRLHSEEMVLPAELANKVRDGSAGGGGHTYNVTINAMDAKSFKDFANQNSDAFHDAVRRAVRDGRRVG